MASRMGQERREVMILVETKVSYDRKAPNAKVANAKSALFRGYVYRHTMMWGSDGLRVLPVELWSEFAEGVDRFQDNLSEFCSVAVHYLPYPDRKPYTDQPDLFEATKDELRRRTNIMYTDVCHRLGLVLDDLNEALKADTDAKRGRLYESTLTGLTNEVKLFRAFNDAAFKDDTLTKILDGLKKFSDMEVDALRKKSDVRREAWQRSIDLLNLLSKA
jgi:hypothetical protein